MRSIGYLFLLLVLFASCKSSHSAVSSSSKSKNDLVDKIIDSAKENIGVGYKSAGTTKSGFDCSGLVYATFKQYDIPLPRTSIEQSKTGTWIGKNTDKAQKGDLIFFKTNKNSQINHVGIVTEIKENEIKFIHTSTSKGVIISSTKEPYYQRTFAQLNRIFE